MNPAVTRGNRWGGDGTTCALSGLNLGETEGTNERRRSQGLGRGMEMFLVYRKGETGVGL